MTTNPQVCYQFSSSQDALVANAIREFRERYGQVAHSGRGLIYSISPCLIDAMEESVPDWFSRPEWDFEAQLSLLCGRHNAIGIQNENFISYGMLEPPRMPTLSPVLFERLGWSHYMTYQEACYSLDLGERRLEPLHDLAQAYLGWLTTNSEFREEVQCLQAVQALVDQEHSCPDDSPEWSAQCNAFCDRWELDGMVTWDLPLPMMPDLAGLAPLTSRHRSSNSVHLSLPVTMRFPARYALGEQLDESRRSQSGQQLREWQRILDGDRANGPGMRRYRQIFLLHFYRNVVLAGRYADRFEGHVQRLDLAFARFLGASGEDNVKKLRQEMGRRMNGD